VITEASTVSLELDSRPRSLALVRGMLSAVGDQLGLGAELLDDVNIAVSEACSNVVLHAYGDGVGPLQIGLELAPQDLVVVIRDRGVGIAQSSPAEGRLGVGVGMMKALATHAQLIQTPYGGTDVRLTFACESLWPQVAAGALAPDGHEQPGVELAGDAVVPSCAIPFLAAVMGRLALLVAAGTSFSLDRLSDLRLLTDAIAAQARTLAFDERIGFGIAAAVRRLELAVGPLFPGSSGRLARADWQRSPSCLPLLLADELTLEPADRCEILRVVITDEPPGPGRT
jgi:serine/threonine-protein kinase RsbW